MKRLFVVLLSALAVTSVNAGITADLNSLFMSNITSAGPVNTKDRTGYFGGSASIRVPIQNVNLIAFDPPRWNFGCGGIDLFAGSFSFINHQQLIAVLRTIASNAAGLIFKASIQAISPSLSHLLGEFQALLQTMNNLGKNSCAMAHLIVDPVAKSVATSLDGEGPTGAADKGVFSDATQVLENLNNNINDSLGKTGQFNPNTGNQVIKALVASGASSILGIAGISNSDGSSDDSSDPNSMNNRVLLSMIGFTIEGVPCATGDTDAGNVSDNTNSSNNLGRTGCNSPRLFTLRDLYDGGGAGSPRPDIPLKLYRCRNPQGNGTPDGGSENQICTSMATDDFSYPGFVGYTGLMFMGSADPTDTPTADSIIGQFNGSSSFKFSDQQQNFLSGVDLPVMRYMKKLTNAGDRIFIANKMKMHVANCLAGTIGKALIKSASLIQKDNHYEFNQDQRDNVKQLRADASYYEDQCAHDRVDLEIAQKINAMTNMNGQKK